ncbi:MAG: hypothetical protein ACO3GP_02595 [Candidatus Limnocylindrus sp.]
MAIQPQIAMGFRPPQIESPLNMMSQFAQLQSAQQANALRQAQMQKMQLDEERRNALMMRAQSGAPLTFADVVPYGEQGFAALKAQQDQLKAQQETEARKQEQMRKRQGTLAQTLFNLRDDPSVDNLARAWQTLKEGGMGEGLESTVAEMLLMTPEQRRAAAEQYIKTTPGMAEYIMGRSKEEAELAKTGMETQRAIAQTDVERARLKGTLPTQPPQQTELARLLAEQKQFPSGTPEFQAYQKAIENYRRGVTIETPVPVVDPSTGQVTYATRQEAIGKTPPQFMEGLTPRERQQREAKFPAAKAAVAAFDQKADKLDNLIEQFVNHPGVNQITGLIGGRIVGITDEGRAAEALYNTIMAQGGFSELQAMRDASTSGGALGSVSNQENQFLRDAFGVTKRTQSTADLIKGFKDVQSTLRSSKLRVRQAFEDTYAYRPEFTQPAPVTPSGGPAAAPAAPAQPSTGAPIQLPKDNADAVYNSLPSGAQFIDPNGVLRRKP